MTPVIDTIMHWLAIAFAILQAASSLAVVTLSLLIIWALVRQGSEDDQ